MTWVGALPTMVLCGVLLVVPGLLITYLIGLRRLAAVAMAPMIVVGVVALTAMISPIFGIRWSPVLMLIVFGGLSLVLACILLPLRKRLPAPAPADGWRVTVAALVGITAAVVFGMLTVIRAITDPDQLIHTSDSPFHYNALVNILNSGNASTLMIDTLGVPDRVRGFYPAAWHGLGSLLIMITGISVPVAANLLSVTIALIIWPLGCMLLMRQLAGPSPMAVGIAGLLSVAFGAFPWELLGWGILWPNLLGLALVPAAMAALMSMVNLAKEDVIGRGRAWLLAPVILATVAISHPNALISLAAVAVSAVVLSLALSATKHYRAGRKKFAYVLGTIIVLAAPAYWVVVRELNLFSRVMEADSPPFESPAHAVGEALTGATNGGAVDWLLAILLIVGIFSCFRQRNRRWLVASHAVSCGIYVLAAGVEGVDRRMFTGFWYTDSHRIAAMIPITGIPITVFGTIAVATLIRTLLRKESLQQFRAATNFWALAVVPLIAILLVLSTNGLNIQDNSERVAVAYPVVHPLLSKEEQALFARLDERTEPGTVIAQTPNNGSTAAMTLSQRQVLFPQLNLGRPTAEQIYLSDHLNNPSDPKVCEMVNRINLRYLLSSDGVKGNYFDGFDYPAPSAGFELIDQAGKFRLYRVSPCDRRPTDAQR
ncbi:DUF6541 family protein [Lentzea californiensis]|uniref:DUF6541 family protein n=1 Tax=Lentzea californiensis TaxID=438851 RepID=UPI0021645153|nr:DUF6541 family protein [Lentzea californiensis]MCR3747237.1 hypothetical protein [Lentzea californiensis]